MDDLGGNLAITIKSGKLHRNTDALGKMDPFIEIEY
jgi:hypothetical protein